MNIFQQTTELFKFNTCTCSFGKTKINDEQQLPQIRTCRKNLTHKTVFEKRNDFIFKLFYDIGNLIND